jgi:hypothetical protein
MLATVLFMGTGAPGNKKARAFSPGFFVGILYGVADFRGVPPGRGIFLARPGNNKKKEKKWLKPLMN